MKINLFYVTIFIIFFKTNLIAETKDCTKINTFTKEYAKCVKDKAKKNLDESGITDKLIKLKKSKTLKELFEKK